jgi:hypothetical protein
MSEAMDLVARLDACALGHDGWQDFENACIDALRHLFVPPLQPPIIQPRTYSGTNRRDAVFPNRNFDERNGWGLLLRELDARMVLFEFKNYDRHELGHEEVIQTDNYLSAPMGRLAVIVSSTQPTNGAHIQRNTIFGRSQKVLLFLCREDLKEMLFIKERGGDPADLIVDFVERFYLQHE